jgi:NAD(P)-dependent dehydrogenase (short-subunit alcohol dehydrogenase family)
MAIRFDDQVAIVTGAGGGLGRSHALEFAARGAHVVINDLGGAVDGIGASADQAQQVVAEIEAQGGKAIAHAGSVTDPQHMADMAQAALSAFGRIDILVNNAGILRDKTFANMDLADFEAVMDVHLMGTVRATKAVWPTMREQGFGRVVVTTSSSGLYGNFGQANYGAAKLALVGLINTLKLEGQKYDIHCNAISPVALTRMTEGLLPPEVEALMTPVRVTPAVMFLSSLNAPNGAILCAGAGVYASVEIHEAPGLYLGDAASPEDIEKNWTKISNMQDAGAHVSGAEQTGKFFEMAAKS